MVIKMDSYSKVVTLICMGFDGNMLKILKIGKKHHLVIRIIMFKKIRFLKKSCIRVK